MLGTKNAPDGSNGWWGIRIPRKDKKKIKYKCDIQYIKWLLTNWNIGDIKIYNEKYKIYAYSNYYNKNYDPFKKEPKYIKGGYKIWKLK